MLATIRAPRLTRCSRCASSAPALWTSLVASIAMAYLAFVACVQSKGTLSSRATHNNSTRNLQVRVSWVCSDVIKVHLVGHSMSTSLRVVSQATLNKALRRPVNNSTNRCPRPSFVVIVPYSRRMPWHDHKHQWARRLLHRSIKPNNLKLNVEVATAA